MRVFYVAAVTACLAISSLAQCQLAHSRNDDKAIQQIIHFRNQYIEAEENKNVGYLNNVFTDDFYALNPQGQLLNKAQQLENIKRVDRTFRVLDPRDTQVYFYNDGNTAVLFEHVTVDGEDKGRHFGGEIRFTRLFIRQHGTWHVALALGTPLATASTTRK